MFFKIRILCLFIIFLLPLIIFARATTLEDVQTIAPLLETLINEKFKENNELNQTYSVDTENILSVKEGNYTVNWVIPLLPQGFVMVAPATELEPISMITLSQNYEDIKDSTYIQNDNIFNVLKLLKLEIIPLNNGIKWLEEGFKDWPLKFLQTVPEIIAQNETKWENIINNTTSIIDTSKNNNDFPYSDEGGPLLPERLRKWHQDYPYNAQIPSTPGIPMRNIVGCGAMSMGQIISYYKYPDKWQSSKEAKNDAIPWGEYNAPIGGFCEGGIPCNNYLYDAGQDLLLNFEPEKSSIPKLLYDIGVAVDMEWTPDESKTTIINQKKAFYDYFGYANDFHFIEPAKSGQQGFIKLAQQITLGHPMILSSRTVVTLKFILDLWFYEWTFASEKWAIKHLSVIDGYKYYEKLGFFGEIKMVHVELGWKNEYWFSGWVKYGNSVVFDEKVWMTFIKEIIDLIPLLDVEYDFNEDEGAQTIMTDIYPYNFCGWNNDGTMKKCPNDDDGVPYYRDNCINASNPKQEDFNKNGIGDACEDSDGDGFLDSEDNCPILYDVENREVILCIDEDKDEVCDNHLLDYTCKGSVDNHSLSFDSITGNNKYSKRDFEPVRFFFDMAGQEYTGFFADDPQKEMIDSCLNNYNPSIPISLGEEIVSGECKKIEYYDGECNNSIDVGAKFNTLTSMHGCEMQKSLDHKIYMWQPDQDLDGVGDACDNTYRYLSNGQRPVDEFAGGRTCSPGNMQICWGVFYKNKYINLYNNYTVKETEENEKDYSKKIESRYCWVNNDYLSNYWGDGGYCTTSNGNQLPLKDEDYAFSHGSDPTPVRGIGIESWKEISKNKTCDDNSSKYTYSNITEILNSDNTQTVTWDWKEDIKCENEKLYNQYIANVSYTGSENLEGIETFFNYTTSAGFKSDKTVPYIIDVNGRSEVNPEYFHNQKVYTRTDRSSYSPVSIGYGMQKGFAGAKVFWKYLDPYPRDNEFLRGCPECFFQDIRDTSAFNFWKYDILTDTVSARPFSMEPEGSTMSIQEDVYKFSRGGDTALVLWMNRENSGTDWQPVSVISSGTVQPYSATYAGKAYITDGTNLYYMGMNNIIQQSMASNSVSAENEATINTAKLYLAAALPAVTNPTLININESLYLLGNGSSVMELYKLSSENQFEKVSSSNAPAIRDRINYSVVNGALYIAGGGNYTSEKYGIAPKTDLWQYTEETGFNQITDSLPEDGIFNLFISATAEKAILFSKQINSEGNALRTEVNLTNGEITTAETAVEGWTSSIVYEENYCIYDTGSRIYPGILKEGECTKLSKYNYDSHTYFDYKKTVAGKSNHLYLGGLSGIREITIEEDGDLNKEKLHWLGNINNIALKDNYLYGAGGNKIEILKIESDGSLSGKNALSTKDCDNIRIHGSYLIAGENKKVTIWDISTLENPKKVKTISVDYPVKDIEIGGNYLYIYHDKLFKTGKLALYDISDILNPVKKDEEKKECNDAELTVSGGEVYMGCKNGQYKAVNSNGSLSLKKMSGEKNYMREAYYYNGVIYQVFSGKLHESK